MNDVSSGKNVKFFSIEDEDKAYLNIKDSLNNSNIRSHESQVEDNVL